MNTLYDLIDKLWKDYSSVNPQAHKIHSLLKSQGERIVNDHIAFRTFNHPKVGVDSLAKSFLQFGYQEMGSYNFEEKKLNARHYEHPDDAYPLVFISELKTECFSEQLQNIVSELVDQVPSSATRLWDFPASKLIWAAPSYETYETLRKESEYAAWLSAFGYCANHFTVSINALKNYDNLGDFNQMLKDNGFPMNDSGGEIKGSPEVYLEQSSTLADPVSVNFSDGPQTIPCCYYEFAKRYPTVNGELFRGFVSKSADKIFESTDKK